MKLDMGAPLWSRTVSLKAGHYYAIRVWRFFFIDAPDFGCYGDIFEISGDE
jgi:hypothetical protein